MERERRGDREKGGKREGRKERREEREGRKPQRCPNPQDAVERERLKWKRLKQQEKEEEEGQMQNFPHSVMFTTYRLNCSAHFCWVQILKFSL